MLTALFRTLVALAFAAFVVYGVAPATVAAHNAAFGHSHPHAWRAHGDVVCNPDAPIRACSGADDCHAMALGC